MVLWFLDNIQIPSGKTKTSFHVVVIASMTRQDNGREALQTEDTLGCEMAVLSARDEEFFFHWL